MNAKQWFKQGKLVTVAGRKIFVYNSSSNTNKNKPTLLILHGYPTCSYDYYKALSYLQKHFRIVIHDHLGFGYSDKPHDYSYSLIEQADFALLLWKKLGIQKAHILAHDYGTSIATEIIARNNRLQLNDIKICSITLCNGSIHIELAKLRLIQKLLLNKLTGPLIAKLSNKKTLRNNLKNIYFNPNQINDVEIDTMWGMIIHNDGRSVLHKTTQYIKERYLFWHRWIGALQNTDLYINIVWAQNDPIAIEKIAHVISNETKHSHLTILKNLGHFPMLEDPETWTNAIIKSIEHMKS